MNFKFCVLYEAREHIIEKYETFTNNLVVLDLYLFYNNY